ncbi:AAA family ATPase [Luedemannella helvata]|uniref:Novel STAND NTPase 1 domain-containing protein n=1 Tax=Luedemannella helvata TaxID=349315 RepID=A0ABP4WTA5_9ACTN
MRRLRWRWHSTGFGVFVLSAGTGLITNLLTNDPERWPPALQPIVRYSPVIGIGLVAAVGIKAGIDAWRNGYRRSDWDGRNPYPGLMAYAEDRAAVFFGRAREIDELVVRVRDARAPTARFVPVVGPSGSGKSSLVLAGLIPALGHGSSFRVLPAFTPGSNAIGELSTLLGVDLTAAAEAARAAERSGSRTPAMPAALAALARLRGGMRHVLIVVDQLEEAVTQGTEQDRHAFVACLQALLEQDPRLRVVATVRSDTIGEFQQGPGRDLFHHPVMVNVMGPREIRLVVDEPARLTATEFESGLVDEIVRETGGGDALPLLSYLLSDLYNGASADRHISWKEYRSSGGVSGAITRRAEAAVRELGMDALPQCLETLRRFVTLGSAGATRQRVTASSLDRQQERVVRAFVDARLLTSDRIADGTVIYDIAHEALLRQWEPLREDIALHEDELRRLTELAPLARAWERSRFRPDYLIGGQRLVEALAWARGERAVAPEIIRFLNESQRNQAGEMERRADRAANDALANLNTNPAYALALAYAALTELAATARTATVLEATLASGLRQVERGVARVRTVAFAPDGNLAVSADDHDVRVVDTASWAGRPVPGSAGSLIALGLDGRLAVVTDDHWIRLCDPTGPQVVSETRGKGRITAMAYAPDGILVVGRADSAVDVYDTALSLVGTWRTGEAVPYSVAVTTGGRVAAGLGDGRVLMWTLAGPRDPSTVAVHRDSVLVVTFGPDDTLASASRDGTLRLQFPTGAARVVQTHRGAITCLTFAPDGRLASGGANGLIEIRSADGRLLHTLSDATDMTRSVAFAADGRLAATCTDGTLWVWDVTGRLITDVPAGTDVFSALAGGTVEALWHRTVHAVATGRDGRMAIACDDGALLWISGEPVLIEHDVAIARLAFDVAGTLHLTDARGDRWVWAAGKLDRATRATEPVFGPTDGVTLVQNRLQMRYQVLLDGRRVNDAAQSGDGHIGAACDDGSIWYVDPRGGHRVLGRHSDTATAVAFAPDGRLASGSADGEVRLWDRDGTLLYARPDRAGRVSSLAFTADGRLLVLCGGLLRIWPWRTPPDVLRRVAERLPRQPLTPQQRQVALLPAEPSNPSDVRS